MSKMLATRPALPVVKHTRVQIVMDQNGDTRHEFDAGDLAAVALAERRFQDLTGSGFRAAALSQNGEPGRLIAKFDPGIDRTLFVPHLKGG
jgi:hypothetical protein